MTTGEGPLDGFLQPPEPLSAGTVVYGGPPIEIYPSPWIPQRWPFSVPETNPPVPPVIILPEPRPRKRLLTVTEDDETILLIALSDDQWDKVRSAIAEALK